MKFNISEKEINKNFFIASQSIRKRYLLALHETGDYKNKIINFLINNTYIQPHMHAGDQKTEYVFILDGKVFLILFDDTGKIVSNILLEKDKSKNQSYLIPSYTYHTYIVLSNKACIYEEMDGVYDSKTWKKNASWAPDEHSSQKESYLNSLLDKIYKKE